MFFYRQLQVLMSFVFGCLALLCLDEYRIRLLSLSTICFVPFMQL